MVALIGFSIITVYSTDLATFGAGGKSYQLTKHLLWILIGSILLITMSKVDYRYLQKLRIPILVVSFMLLLLVLIPGIGTVTNGARRWIRLGHTLGIQPSEFAKLALIIFVSACPVSCVSVYVAMTSNVTGFTVPVITRSPLILKPKGTPALILSGIPSSSVGRKICRIHRVV